MIDARFFEDRPRGFVSKALVEPEHGNLRVQRDARTAAFSRPRFEGSHEHAADARFALVRAHRDAFGLRLAFDHAESRGAHGPSVVHAQGQKVLG